MTMTINEAVTRQPRRGRPGNDRTDVILAAVRLFNQHGYEATTVGMIADQLSVSKSAIYHHVASKEDLLASALDRALDALESTLQGEKATDGPLVERLEHVIRGTVAALVNELESVTLLLRLRGNTELERRAMARRRNFDRAVAELFRATDDAGELRHEINPKIATRLVFGMINSIIEWYQPDGALGAQELGDIIIDLLFSGMRPREVTTTA